MFRTRTILTRLALLMLAATALYLSSVGSASAGWLIEGSELSGTAALATKEAVTEALKLEAAGIGIECAASSVNATGSVIEAPNLILASSLTFNECKATEPCSVVSKSIVTLPLSAEVLEGLAPEDIAMLGPKTSKILALIHFAGNECALSGTEPLTGTEPPFPASLPTGQEAKTSQVLNTEAVGQLKLGISEAYLQNATSLELASGKSFLFVGERSKLFRLSVSKTEAVATFTVENISVLNNVKMGRLIPKEKNALPDKVEWKPQEPNKKDCEGMKYEQQGAMNMKDKCKFTETYIRMGGGASALKMTVEDANQDTFTDNISCDPENC